MISLLLKLSECLQTLFACDLYFEEDPEEYLYQLKDNRIERANWDDIVNCAVDHIGSKKECYEIQKQGLNAGVLIDGGSDSL